MTTIPRMEVILDRVRRSRERYNGRMQPPADDAMIAKLQADCRARFGLRIPERYCHLLRITDALNWNGVYFHGTARRPYADHPDMTLGGLLEETTEWWHWQQKLILGNIEDQYFFYDQEADEYQVYRVSDNKPYRRFKEFDELFAHAFDGRFPEHDDALPPPPWERAG